MTVWTDAGNCRKFELTPKPTMIEHKNYMGGKRFVDAVFVTEVAADFVLTLDEWTLDNAGMVTLGLKVTDTVGDYIEIMGASLVERQLKFEGANDFGPRWEVILPRVFLIGDKATGLIADADTPLELSGKLLLPDPAVQSFGTFRPLGSATGGAPIASPSVLNYYVGMGKVYTAPVA